jgi:hypothetical protein
MELSTGRILEENLFQSAFHQILGDIFTFQQDSNLKHKANIHWSSLPRWQWKLLKTSPERLTAVIDVKGASTKYWLRGVNTYVNKICFFFFFFLIATISKNIIFTLSLWCVHRWLRKNIFNPFRIQAVSTTKCGISQGNHFWSLSLVCTVTLENTCLCCAILVGKISKTEYMF